MAICAKCNARSPDGMAFCTQCGSPISKADLPAASKAVPPCGPEPDRANLELAQPVCGGPPAPSKPAPEVAPKTELKAPEERPQPAAEAKPSPPSKPESLDLELPPPETASTKLDLEEAKDRRRASGATGEVVCKFCKGPLDLQGGFCESCGAPVEEAAPPGFVKRKPKAVTSAASLAVPPSASATPPLATAQAPASGQLTPSSRVTERKMPTAVAPAAPAKPTLAAAPAAAVTKGKSPVPPAIARQAAPPSPPPQRRPEKVASLPAAPPKAAVSSHVGTAGPPPQRAPAVSPPPAARAEAKVKVVIPTTKRASLPLGGVVLAGIAMVVIAAGAVLWYFLRPAAVPVKPSPRAAATPATAKVAAPAPAETSPAPEEAAAEVRPRAARVAKPAPVPAPAEPAVDSKKARLVNLQNLARDAYAKGNFAEPSGASAIGYLTQALAIDPNDDYSKKLLESAVSGGTYQVQQAITKKDFATAHRLAGEMGQLLPDRKDVAGLKEDIASAQRAEEAAHRPLPAAPQISFRVMHMHTDKSPADKGPYCEGNLSVIGGHLKFAAQSATDGQTHSFDLACSDVREVKKNSRVASHQGGFHVRTTQANYNFVPADAGSSPVSALASACSK